MSATPPPAHLEIRGLAIRAVHDVSLEMRPEESVTLVGSNERSVRLAFTVADRASVMETGRGRLEGAPAGISRAEAVVRAYLGG